MKRVKASDRAADTFTTTNQFAKRLAAQLDAMTMLAGAAGAYRKALQAQGFCGHIAEALAANWAAAMQTMNIGGAE